MPEPDFSGFLPTVLLVLSVIVFITIGLVHEFYLMPPVSRKLRGAKWTRGVTAFIQDLSGNVLCITSKKDLPEGIIKTARGYFLLPMVGTSVDKLPQVAAYKRRGPGRPPKETAEDLVPEVPKTEKEIASYAEMYGMMVHVPILKGLGKQVFFGSIESPMLANLWSIAHASLLETKRFIPTNMTKTQLDALATGERMEGQKMMGGDIMKWFVYVILACIPIAIIGLVFWFLTQGNAPAPAPATTTLWAMLKGLG